MKLTKYSCNKPKSERNPEGRPSANNFEKATGVTYRFWELFVRPQVLRIKGKKCEKCGDTENIDVHHTSYKHQNINTFLVLCRSCHKQWHNNNTVEE